MENTDPTDWVYESDTHSTKDHMQGRIDKGYSTYDWWNFMDYNSWVMINALEDFKTGMGHPVYGEVQTMEDWVRVLTEIQDGFIAQRKISNDIPTGEEYEELKAKWERGMELLTIYYGSLWD